MTRDSKEWADWLTADFARGQTALRFAHVA